MRREQLARWLLIAAALSTLIVPVATDAVFLAKAHMDNPAWLLHAKLHCAMSFFAGAALGLAALAILFVRPTTDRFSMGLATFLGSAFWVGPIAAGFSRREQPWRSIALTPPRRTGRRGAKVVKAFNTTFAEILASDSRQFGEQIATIFYCGDDRGAKDTVADLIEECGYEATLRTN